MGNNNNYLRFTDHVDASWMADGLCVDVSDDLAFEFYPSRSFDEDGYDDATESMLRPETVAALELCRQCPVRRECLRYAYATKEKHGIWGGLTSKQRATVLNRRRRRKVA